MNSIQRAFTLLALTVLLFAGVQAQTTARFIQVHVPFEFQVGNEVLPAGEYSITRANPYILVLRDSHERVVASVVPAPAQASAAPAACKLVFYVDGERNVLARIWSANSRYGYELPVPRNWPAFAKVRTTEVQAATGR
jgi:hypothetical protein